MTFAQRETIFFGGALRRSRNVKLFKFEVLCVVLTVRARTALACVDGRRGVASVRVLVSTFLLSCSYATVRGCTLHTCLTGRVG